MRPARAAPLALLGAVLLASAEARAVRLWEEPRPGYLLPQSANPPGTTSFVGVFSQALAGSIASPDLRPAESLTPLAAGNHVGASRFPAGVAERWLDVGFFTLPRLTVQTGYDPGSADNVSLPPGVTVPVTRLVLHGQAHPMFQARVEIDVSSAGVRLLDAYALAPFTRWLQVQMGQFRVPFSRQALIAPSRLQFVDPSLWSFAQPAGPLGPIDAPRGPGYDLGIMAWGWVGPRDLIEYYVGIFNGEGPNRLPADAFFLYAGRVVVNPLGRPRGLQEGAVFQREPSLAIGASFARQTQRVAAGAGPQVLATASMIGADVNVVAFGASLYGEVYYRALETTGPMLFGTESLGWLAQAGYFIPHPALRDHLEVVARVQSLNPSDCFTGAFLATCTTLPVPARTPAAYRDFQYTTALTFGVNWYQSGHGFKVQASYTLNLEGRDVMGRPAGSGAAVNDLIQLQITGSI